MLFRRHVYVNRESIEIGPLLISLIYFLLMLQPPRLIYFQHIFGHHPYTNIDGFDPDISTAHHVSYCAINSLLKTCIRADASFPRHLIS